jgi:hypothetical protein
MATPQLNSYFKTFKTDSDGRIEVTGILNVEAYNSIDFMIIQWPHANVTMSLTADIGKISGATLAQSAASFQLGTTATIHSVKVIGPEFSLTLLGGPVNTDVPIQAWVFLH